MMALQRLAIPNMANVVAKAKRVGVLRPTVEDPKHPLIAFLCLQGAGQGAEDWKITAAVGSYARETEEWADLNPSLRATYLIEVIPLLLSRGIHQGCHDRDH